MPLQVLANSNVPKGYQPPQNMDPKDLIIDTKLMPNLVSQSHANLTVLSYSNFVCVLRQGKYITEQPCVFSFHNHVLRFALTDYFV